MSTPFIAGGADNPQDSLENDLRLILDNVPALVKTLTPTGAIDYANQRLLDYLGVDLDQLSDWPTFIHESDRPAMIERLQRSLEDGQPYEAECRLRRVDGVYRWVRGSAVPALAKNGAIVRWYYLITDIDDRKRAEELLQASERQLRAIVDNIPTMVAIHNVSGELEWYNRIAREYHGPCVENSATWRLSDVVHPDDLPALLVSREHAVRTGEPVESESRLRRADGTYRWFHVRAVRHEDFDGTLRWYSVRTDIHDRKMTEDALRQSEARLLEVQRISRTGSWRYLPSTDTVESSPEADRMYGVQPGDDTARPSYWFDRIHPEDRPRIQAEVERCMRENTDYRAGYRIIRPDGSTCYQYSTGHAVTDDTGGLVEFIGASMDMTEHWLATIELERASKAVRELQARMSRAAQIATVGELAGSIAHEVNQPLAAVVANAHACVQWLSASPPNVPKALAAAQRIARDGKDAGDVVQRVRALFKRTVVEKVHLDLGEVIGEVTRLLDSYPARRHVALDVLLEPELPHVLADRVQLQQLLLNLMLNALEALEPVTGRERLLSVRANCADAKRVVIKVSDNGIGIDDSVAAFEPFVTTKPDGMGLGLAICRSIVAAHDGTLSAERNTDFGTTFTIAIPIVRA